MKTFNDRAEAGRKLAQALESYRGRDDVIVLALPRGGVPVGFEVAKSLQAPLDVLVVRKLGVPGHEELAMGAITAHEVVVLNGDIVAGMGISATEIERVTRAEAEEVNRRNLAYRAGRMPLQVRGRTAILVDDGLATGATMKAGILALRKVGARAIIVAVPVGPPDTCDQIRRMADDVVCLMTPASFGSVGRWYREFGQVSDGEVRDLLAQADAAVEAPPHWQSAEAGHQS